MCILQQIYILEINKIVNTHIDPVKKEKLGLKK